MCGPIYSVLKYKIADVGQSSMAINIAEYSISAYIQTHNIYKYTYIYILAVFVYRNIYVYIGGTYGYGVIINVPVLERYAGQKSIWNGIKWNQHCR